MRLVVAILAAVHLIWIGGHASAEGPSKNLDVHRVIYGNPDLPDHLSRSVIDELAAVLGTPLAFENLPAAAGAIAADRVANALPDGRTMYIAGVQNIAILPALDDSLTYSPFRDFAPVSQLFEYPHVLIINRQLPARSLREFISLAREQPGKMTYAHFGTTGSVHIATEWLKKLTGADLRPVTYRSAPALLTDFASGQVNLCVCRLSLGLSIVQQKGAAALAVTSLQRSRFAPLIPTTAEAGVPDFVFVAWAGLFVPAGTPSHLIEQLYRSVATVLNRRHIRRIFEDAMIEPQPSVPSELYFLMDKEYRRWGAIVHDAGVRLAN